MAGAIIVSTEKDLSRLLATLDIERHDGVWAFSSSPDHPGTFAAMAFKEREGWTSVSEADMNTAPDNKWAWLELTVYSDLNAVGFLARIAAALAEVGIPCNAVAAFHHDHIFVPEDKADDAVSALKRIKTSAASPE